MTTLNASDYTIGQAELYFAETEANATHAAGGAQADPTSFGNIVTAEITPDVTYVDHNISVKGNIRKDKQVAVNKSITIPFTFDELNVENLRRFMLGTAVENTGSTMPVMKKESFEGRAILNFQTSVGNNFTYNIPKCNLRADGGIAFNSDDWMQGNFVLEVLYHDTYQTLGSPSLEYAPYGYMDFDSAAIGSPF